MATTARSRPVVTVLAGALFVVAILLYAAVVANIATINDSDPAGNGLSYAYGVIMTIVPWILLAILLLVAGIWGEMPGWAKFAALVLVPASCAAALAAIELSRGQGRAVGWPIVIPALAPLLIMAYALWAYLPRLRQAASARSAGPVVWGALVVLSLLPWPQIVARERAHSESRAQIEAAYEAERAQQEAIKRGANRENFAQLTSDSPLWEWWDFTLPGNELREPALAAMRQLPRRQLQAEAMLEDGFSLPMTELPNLALEATPSLCLAARRFLRKHADSLRPTVPDPAPYAVMAPRIEAYLPGMRWLVDHQCDCNQELNAFEVSARAYRDSPERRQFLATLKELRRPGRPPG